MNRLLLFILMFTLVPVCFAETYQVNSTFAVYSDLYNGSYIYSAINQTAYTSVFASDDSLVNSGFMAMESGPKFIYNLSINTTGQFYRRTDYFVNGIAVGNSSETFQTVNNINSIAQDTTDMVQTIFQTFIIFLVPFLLAVLAQYTMTEYLFIFSGVWFMGSSANLAFTGISWTQWSFFALLGVFLIYHGISIIIEKNERNKKIKEKNELYESSTLND